MLSQLYKPFLAKIFATVCLLAASLVSLRLFSKFLTPAEFGIFIVAAQALAYVPYLDGGVRTASNCRLLALDSEGKRSRLLAFSQKFYSWFAVAVVLVLLLLMGLYWLTPNVRESGHPLAFFLIFGITGGVLVSAGAQASLLVGMGAQNAYFWIQGGGALVNLLTLAIGFQFGLGLWAFPLANAAMTLFSWPVCLHLIRKRVPGIRAFDFHLNAEFWQELRDIRRQALDSFGSQLAMLFLYSIEIVIVGMTTSPAEAAIYALLVRILAIIRSFIQSLGEVSWPLIAQEKTGSSRWSEMLLRLNAWIYGSVAGAILITLLPFLNWYMGAQWTASNSLLILLLMRFVIVGIHSPAGYFLLGRSEFKTLAKYNGLELAAAVLFSLALLPWGSAGVAIGFLGATVFGTLFPIFGVYARLTGGRLGTILSAVWIRVLAGFAVSCSISWLLISRLDGKLALPVAAVATLAGVSLPFLFRRLSQTPSLARPHDAT